MRTHATLIWGVGSGEGVRGGGAGPKLTNLLPKSIRSGRVATFFFSFYRIGRKVKYESLPRRAPPPGRMPLTRLFDGATAVYDLEVQSSLETQGGSRPPIKGFFPPGGSNEHSVGTRGRRCHRRPNHWTDTQQSLNLLLLLSEQ